MSRKGSLVERAEITALVCAALSCDRDVTTLCSSILDSEDKHRRALAVSPCVIRVSADRRSDYPSCPQLNLNRNHGNFSKSLAGSKGATAESYWSWMKRHD